MNSKANVLIILKVENNNKNNHDHYKQTLDEKYMSYRLYCQGNICGSWRSGFKI